MKHTYQISVFEVEQGTPKEDHISHTGIPSLHSAINIINNIRDHVLNYVAEERHVTPVIGDFFFSVMRTEDRSSDIAIMYRISEEC